MELTHEQLEKSIDKSYSTGIPLFIAGTTGIGKSCTVRKVSKRIATNDEEREFLEWNELTSEEKRELRDSKEKREQSFLLIDMRISQMDPTDLRGLPNLNGEDFVEWNPPLSFSVLSKEGVRGVLFFDEINLAPPSVQSAAYQIILDKAIGQISLNKNLCIIGAGNRVEDRANVFEMAAPLKNRFTHVGLKVPSVEDWSIWATENDIDNRIVGYLNFKRSHLMVDISKIGNSRSGAFPTPRSWEYCSNVIDGLEDLDTLEQFVSSCVGDGVAVEFKSFLKLKKDIDLMDVMDNPEKVKEMSLDLKWCLISAVADRYASHPEDLSKALNVAKHLEADFGATLLRMIKRSNEKHFMKNVQDCDEWEEIAKEYKKYIL